MKYSIVYSFLLLLFVTGCRKDDNPKIPGLIRVPTPLITKDQSGDATISKDEPLAFQGKFIVDLFFKTDIPPQKMDVVVRKNNGSVKVFKEGLTTFPTTVEITGADLQTLFGEAPVLGDKFEVGVDITTRDGYKAEAFPAVGSPYGSNVGNQPGSSLRIDYSVVCPFDINDLVGDAVIEDPDFWEATYPVKVELEGTDTYKISGWIEDPNYVVRVKVNTATLTATIATQVYTESYPGLPYTNWTTEGEGVIDACGKKLVMTLDNYVDQGSFGTQTITLRK
jgi:hypothetical protein